MVTAPNPAPWEGKLSTTDRLSDQPLTDSLRKRLQVIASHDLNGLYTHGIVTRGDQALIDRGLVKLIGEWLHLTRSGREVVR